MRRTLLIILIIVALAIIGVAAYFFFFGSKGPGVTVGTPTTPFGTSDDYVEGEQLPVGQSSVGAGEEVGPSLIRVSEGPVAEGLLAFPVREVRTIGDAGATSSATTTVRDTELRYVERSSGNIYAFRATERTLTRITNETLTSIQEVTWLADGSRAYLRFLSEEFTDRVETYALPLSESTDGYFLEPNLEQIIPLGSTTAVTLLPSTTGSTATVTRGDGSVVRTLFTSDLASLRIAPAGTSVVAYTKPSASVNGYGFLVNTSGSFELIAGPLRGLTLLPSPSGKTILSGYRQGNALRLELINAAAGTVTTLPVSTLPEKCVWSRNETALYCAIPRSQPQGLPDSWYQGSVSFSDRIWKISVTDRVAVLVVDPRELAEVDIDAVSLTLDSESDTLSFVNRIDGSLWLYDL